MAAACRNSLHNLSLVPAAVGDVDGQVQLRSNPAFTLHDAGVRSMFGTGSVVGSFPITTLDSWTQKVSLSRADLIKIDVEGAELAALMGMRSTLALLQPRLLLVELNAITLDRAGVTEEQLYEELERSCYAPVDVLSDHGTIENVVFARA